MASVSIANNRVGKSNRSAFLMVSVNSVISLLQFCAPPAVGSSKVLAKKNVVTFKREVFKLGSIFSSAPQCWQERLK
jgi:hypothetical protein